MIRRIIQSLIVALIFLCGSTYADEVPFMEHLISENFKAPDFSYPADIDEDGDIDVAVVSRIGGKIAWFENNGGSPPIFTEHIVGYSNDARGVFVTDVDGDGEPDMLTTSALGGQEVIWWESDGAVPPNFTKHKIPVNGYDWFPVFATDLDDDGDTDVLVGNGPSGAYANRVIWLENNGSTPPSFTERGISTAVNWPYRLFATDLDDDGDIDVLSASMWDDKIAWYENDGGSPPEFFQRVISTNVDQASHVTAADVDGDGDLDVLSGSNRSDYKIAWFENDGNIPPTFTEQIITNTAGHPLFTFPTDVDDDGDIDVLATHMYADKLVWYDNNGESLPTFTERIIANLYCPPPFTLCFAPRNIYGGYDIDGDGDSDVLALTTMNLPVEDPGGKLLWYENKQLDFDHDGIHNDVDEDPNVYSQRFSDLALGGVTSGQIQSLGTGITIEIMDAADPNGVRVIVSGPVDGVAKIKIDGSKGTYKLSPGEHIITSGSVTLEVLYGSAEIEFLIEGSLILVHVEGKVVCEETIVDGELQALDINVAEGYVTVNGETISPGGTHTTLSVDIDIKPGSAPNCFNNDGHGVIPVAILSSNQFDATQVDPVSVILDGQEVKVVGKKGNLLAHIEDVNSDGLDDLMLQIQDQDGIYQEGDTIATLTGKTFDGTAIVDTDSICIVP